MFLTRFLNCTYVLISVSGLRNRLEMQLSSESWLTKASYKSELTGKNHKNCSKLLQPKSVRLFKCFAIRMKKSIPFIFSLPGGSFWRFRWSWRIRRWCSDQSRPSWTRTSCPRSSASRKSSSAKIFKFNYHFYLMRTRFFLFSLMRTRFFFVIWCVQGFFFFIWCVHETKCQKLFCFHGLPKLFVVLDSNCDLAFSIWAEKKVDEHLKTVCLHIPCVAIFLAFLRRSLGS